MLLSEVNLPAAKQWPSRWWKKTFSNLYLQKKFKRNSKVVSSKPTLPENLLIKTLLKGSDFLPPNAFFFQIQYWCYSHSRWYGAVMGVVLRKRVPQNPSSVTVFTFPFTLLKRGFITKTLVTHKEKLSSVTVLPILPFFHKTLVSIEFSLSLFLHASQLY